MPYFVVSDFSGGQDNRKSKVTLPSGSLVRLLNAHVTRGGEIEKRKAFVPKYTFGPGTFGVAAVGNTLYTFGSTGARPRSTLTVTGGTSNPGTNRVTSIKIGDIEVLGAPVNWVTSHAATAAAIAAQINNFTSDPNWYSENTSGSAVFSVIHPNLTAEFNGLGVTVTVQGNVTVSAVNLTSGGINAPVVPSGVNYLRILHPDDINIALSAVLFTDIFDGKIYVVGEFADGSIHHFYGFDNLGGVIPAALVNSQAALLRVADWFDGRARGSFDIVSGTASGGVQATTAFDITGGTSNPGTNKISSITINGVEVLGAAVDWATSHSATATAVANQINTFASTPNYTAAANGTTVTITHPSPSATPNGFATVVTVAGDVTTTAAAAMAGGVAPAQITSIKVNGVEILSVAISYGATAAETAEDVAAQINSFNSSPEYTASAQGARVVILATADAGDGPNGFEVLVTKTGTVEIDNVTSMARGVDAVDTLPPGRSVRTIENKMYSTSGPKLHFSAIGNPTKYTTDQIGAGFINMSNHAAGSEELMAVETYYEFVAIFARNAIQIWQMFADDADNTKRQVLKRTGTFAPKSVVSYNDGDVVYLAESGIRTIKARDSNNTASIAELSTAIDTAIINHMGSLTVAEREAAIAVVEPQDNRLWMFIGNRAFVFSFFSGSKISAWSEYDLGFTVDDAVVVGRQVYVRSGDVVYLYGGDDGETYGNDYEVIAELPFIDGRTIATWKEFSAIDVALEGRWTLEAATNLNAPDAYEEIGIISGPTFSDKTSAFVGESTHVSWRLTHQGAGAANIASLVTHYIPNVAD